MKQGVFMDKSAILSDSSMERGDFVDIQRDVRLRQDGKDFADTVGIANFAVSDLLNE